MMRFQIVLRVWAAVGLTMFVSAQLAHSGTPGDDLDALNSEQARLAGEMLRFISTTEDRFFAAVSRFNGTAPAETRSFEFEDADYTVTVMRGEVIEKAGFTTSMTKTGIRPFTQDALWSRTVTVNVHPKTPLVGFFHGFVAFQINPDGKSSMGGSMDIVPATRIDEDLSYIKEAVEQVFERHGADLTNYRKVVSSGQRIKNLKAARIGVSFYARPFLDITQENFDLVTETFDAFLDAYLLVLEKRQDQPYSPVDLAAQSDMRMRWFEDQMLHDPYALNVIPYPVRSFANYPPVVTY